MANKSVKDSDLELIRTMRDFLHDVKLNKPDLELMNKRQLKQMNALIRLSIKALASLIDDGGDSFV